MSKRYDVVMAVKALTVEAMDQATVRGFDQDTARPQSVGPHGTVIGHPGDPSDPDVDLNPVTYHWQHEMEMEFAASPAASDPAADLDGMLEAFGNAIIANRTLGGLVDWLDVAPGAEDDQLMNGAATTRWASLTVTAHYSTTNPLGQ